MIKTETPIRKRSGGNDRVRLNALPGALLSRWVAAVWALARSPQANILTRSRTAISLRHIYNPKRSPNTDLNSAVFKRHSLELNQMARIPILVPFYPTLSFKLTISPAHYFIIVRDAQESLVWKLCPIFPIDSNASANQVAYINTVFCIWANHVKVFIIKQAFKRTWRQFCLGLPPCVMQLCKDKLTVYGRRTCCLALFSISK